MVDGLISANVKTLAPQDDVAIRPVRTRAITIPKIGGEFLPPKWVDDVIMKDLSNSYAKQLDRALLGVHPTHKHARKQRQAPRRMPSYRERQRRARQAIMVRQERIAA